MDGYFHYISQNAVNKKNKNQFGNIKHKYFPPTNFGCRGTI